MMKMDIKKLIIKSKLGLFTYYINLMVSGLSSLMFLPLIIGYLFLRFIGLDFFQEFDESLFSCFSLEIYPLENKPEEYYNVNYLVKSLISFLYINFSIYFLDIVFFSLVILIYFLSFFRNIIFEIFRFFSTCFLGFIFFLLLELLSTIFILKRKYLDSLSEFNPDHFFLHYIKDLKVRYNVQDFSDALIFFWNEKGYPWSRLTDDVQENILNKVHNMSDLKREIGIFIELDSKSVDLLEKGFSIFNPSDLFQVFQLMMFLTGSGLLIVGASSFLFYCMTAIEYYFFPMTGEPVIRTVVEKTNANLSQYLHDSYANEVIGIITSQTLNNLFRTSRRDSRSFPSSPSFPNNSDLTTYGTVTTKLPEKSIPTVVDEAIKALSPLGSMENTTKDLSSVSSISIDDLNQKLLLVREALTSLQNSYESAERASVVMGDRAEAIKNNISNLTSKVDELANRQAGEITFSLAEQINSQLPDEVTKLVNQNTDNRIVELNSEMNIKFNDINKQLDSVKSDLNSLTEQHISTVVNRSVIEINRIRREMQIELENHINMSLDKIIDNENTTALQLAREALSKANSTRQEFINTINVAKSLKQSLSVLNETKQRIVDLEKFKSDLELKLSQVSPDKIKNLYVELDKYDKEILKLKNEYSSLYLDLKKTILEDLKADVKAISLELNEVNKANFVSARDTFISDSTWSESKLADIANSVKTTVDDADEKAGLAVEMVDKALKDISSLQDKFKELIAVKKKYVELGYRCKRLETELNLLTPDFKWNKSGTYSVTYPQSHLTTMPPTTVTTQTTSVSTTTTSTTTPSPVTTTTLSEGSKLNFQEFYEHFFIQVMALLKEKYKIQAELTSDIELDQLLIIVNEIISNFPI